MADFNYFLNRQGYQGEKGEKGDTGFSPNIEVSTDTAEEFKLTIHNEFEDVVTPNLKSNPLIVTGDGKYVIYDAENDQIQNTSRLEEFVNVSEEQSIEGLKYFEVNPIVIDSEDDTVEHQVLHQGNVKPAEGSSITVTTTEEGIVIGGGGISPEELEEIDERLDELEATSATKLELEEKATETLVSARSYTNIQVSSVRSDLESVDANLKLTKQDKINDLTTIRSNAEAGKAAKDAVDNMGDIVTHDAEEFQPAGDYPTIDILNQRLSTKQDTLTAGANITIENGVISASDAPEPVIYTGDAPINVDNTTNKISIAIDNSTIKVNEDNQLAADFSEIGDELNTLANRVVGLEGQTAVIEGDITDITGDIDMLKDDVVENTQMINTISAKVDELQLFKFPNATIVGEPLISNGQVSGFTENDYMQFPFILDLHNRPFQIDFCFTTGNDVTTQQNILDSQFGLALAINEGKGLMAVSSNGTSWDIGSVQGALAIQPNTTYFARLAWSGAAYTTSISTDGEAYTQDMIIESSLRPFPRTIFIGGCPSSVIGHTTHSFTGSINMNKCSLIVNGQVIWEGMDDVGIATRASVDLNNITTAGEQVIKDLASTVSPQIDVATTETAGIVKPDGSSITVDADGTIHAAGSTPTNMVTTDTEQRITGTKTIPTDVPILFDSTRSNYDGASIKYTYDQNYGYDTLTTSLKNNKSTTGQGIETILTFNAFNSARTAIFNVRNTNLTAPKYGSDLNQRAIVKISGSSTAVDTSYCVIDDYANIYKYSTTGSSRLQISNNDVLFYKNSWSANSVSLLPKTATTEQLGNVKPDGTSITVDSDGTIHAVSSAPTDVVRSTDVSNIVKLTQAEYDELAEKDANTLYTIADASGEDLSSKLNVDVDNLSATGSSTISGLGMPSDRYIDLTLGASGTTYTAPASGYYTISKTTGGTDYKYFYFRNETNGIRTQAFSVGGTGSWLETTIPVKKNDVIKIVYNATGTTNQFRFVYAEGEQN